MASMMPLDGTTVDMIYSDANRKGFFDGVFGCLRPVWSFIGKAAAVDLKNQGFLNWNNKKVIKLTIKFSLEIYF